MLFVSILEEANRKKNYYIFLLNGKTKMYVYAERQTAYYYCILVAFAQNV